MGCEGSSGAKTLKRNFGVTFTVISFKYAKMVTNSVGHTQSVPSAFANSFPPISYHCS